MGYPVLYIPWRYRLMDVLLILDGNSEIGTHVQRKNGNFFWFKGIVYIGKFKIYFKNFFSFYTLA